MLSPNPSKTHRNEHRNHEKFMKKPQQFCCGFFISDSLLLMLKAFVPWSVSGASSGGA
jgi:hypothetical protein